MKRPRLVAISGPEAPKEIPIPQGGLSIGRDPSNQLWLDDVTVSGEHARIVHEKGQILYDMGSPNGIPVDGRASLKQLLRHGSRIQLGVFIFIYLEDDDSVDALPVIVRDERDRRRKL